MKELANKTEKISREVIRLNKRKELLEFKGKVKWEGDLNEMRAI